MKTEIPFTRRDFLKLGSFLAASVSIPGKWAEIFAAGLEKMTSHTPVVWIQTQSCTGDSVSLLNSTDPEPADLLTRYITLVVHQTLGAAQGQTFMKALDDAAFLNGYLLVIEGSIPLGMPQACLIGGRPAEEILVKLIPKAKAVVAVGTCSAFGGIPAAEGNPTGSGSVQDLMNKHHLSWKRKLVNCPSCPPHPKPIIGTLAYLAAKGYPEVDEVLLTPRFFYGTSTHDQCPRYHDYERKIFSRHFGDPHGCLFKLGCLGPLTRTECPHRQWNGGVNWCIRASAPCIGCSSPHFAKKKNFPFYRLGEKHHSVEYTEKDRKGV
ncbi:MAG: hydrogenase small subunit [Anaerohalosphaeraceae bacterium]